MQDNIITWNLENWITVVLMASLGFVATGALVSFARSRNMKLPFGGNQVAQQ